MAISKTDSKRMRQLAQEGKQISKILSEDFPKLDYSDVYFEVYNAGQSSALGIKRMITNRIEAMAANTSKTQRNIMATELNELVWHLYQNHKKNREKLSKIRAALGE